MFFFPGTRSGIVKDSDGKYILRKCRLHVRHLAVAPPPTPTPVTSKVFHMTHFRLTNVRHRPLPVALALSRIFSATSLGVVGVYVLCPPHRRCGPKRRKLSSRDDSDDDGSHGGSSAGHLGEGGAGFRVLTSREQEFLAKFYSRCSTCCFAIGLRVC